MGNDCFHIESTQTPEQMADTRARREAIAAQMRAENNGEMPKRVAAAHVVTAVANDDYRDGIARIGTEAKLRPSDRINAINECPVRGC